METRKSLKWNRIFKINMMVGLFILAITSCDMENDNSVELTNEEEVAVVENSTTVETYADEDLDITVLAEAGFEDSQQRSTSDSLCAIRTWNTESKTLTIDFGEGCTGPYGRQRSGKILITYSGDFGSFTKGRLITFDNYFVNNRQITGAIEIDKFVLNEQSNYENSFRLIAYTVSFPNGETFVLNGERNREFLQGLQDSEPLIMRLTGNMQGIDSRGRSFTSEIKAPIISDVSCAAVGGFKRLAGEKEVVYAGLTRNRVRTILYGDGTCDNTIEVIINGKSYIITKS